MVNSTLPETHEMARAVAGLLIGEPIYFDLDVLQATEFEQR